MRTENTKTETLLPALPRLNRSARPTVLFQLVIERDSVDVQNVGGMALIASTFLHHAQDVGPLHVLQFLARAVGDSWVLENEVPFLQFRLLAHYHSALHRVLQFTDVSEPGLLLQLVHGRRGYSGDAFVHRQRKFVNEVIDQHRNVVRTLAQRWQFDPKDVEPVEEIGAELTFF